MLMPSLFHDDFDLFYGIPGLVDLMTGNLGMRRRSCMVTERTM